MRVSNVMAEEISQNKMSHLFVGSMEIEDIEDDVFESDNREDNLSQDYFTLPSRPTHPPPLPSPAPTPTPTPPARSNTITSSGASQLTVIKRRKRRKRRRKRIVSEVPSCSSKRFSVVGNI